MKTQPIFNILEGFDFSNLDNPEFKEDAVREELVVPIIKGLGYRISKPNQIIRSRKLLHPFVSIGSKREKIYIIPDYLFEVNDRPAWIMDAKGPREALVKSKHVEQAYSYAMHNEIRVNYFALCNGYEFVLYDVSKIEPVLRFPLPAISLYWGDLQRILSPQTIFNNAQAKLAKDLGLHLKRLGFDQFESMFFPSVPLTNIGQLDPDMYSTSGAIINDGERFVVTFDFDALTFQQLKGKIPDTAFNDLSKRENGPRKAVSFANDAFVVHIDCRVGSQLEENTDEIFQPLVVNRFI
ncbi:type I restriction enzyme HsdR N-terminal domain-containing protein [Daejeonella lutea]|uniref:Type I restriction enzyme R protein N terminus (HSDR_N) n=1 Tax=Daejeonella lutea TaxID=572036 RepID=A0A1T5B097_9SPHI|nr:type I restriction enzyme HsdR N-terminal domain-containing protein [Daejeonella lutea]SKB40634.1 Type I restriction enzyme R protein N terminus (HSDR_N) [Daejeonella lutea]